MTAPADSVLDPEIVDQLRLLAQAGNPELLSRLQASFARDAPLRLEALRAALAGGDADAVAFNLHSLKGSAANLGAVRVVALCRQMEDAPQAPGPQEAEALLADLARHLASAEAELARLAASG